MNPKGIIAWSWDHYLKTKEENLFPSSGFEPWSPETKKLLSYQWAMLTPLLHFKNWQFKLQHSHPRTNFILISGKTGTIIGRPYLVQTCTDISTLNITTELSLQFDCVSDVGRKNLCLFSITFLDKRKFNTASCLLRWI